MIDESQAFAADPVNQAMLELGVSPAPVDRSIRNVSLTDEQYDDYAKIAGRMAKMRLDAIVNSPDWSHWPPNAQHDVIQEVIKQSRETARGYIIAKDPTIVQRAYRQKMEKLRGHAE